jgi:ankyrin repeat protein
MTPLHWACDRGKVDVIKCLVDHGAKINAKDNEGQTSLHYTTSCGHRSASCYLLSNGADATSLDNDGNTPLDVCEQTIIDIFK